MAVTILDGSTFLICDRRGDVDGGADSSGFFAADTRFLSRLVLTVDGVRSEPVSIEQAAPHVALFELRGPGGLRVLRELFVGQGLEEAITLENTGSSAVDAVVEIQLGSDFADIHAVKRVADGGAVRPTAPVQAEQWGGSKTVAFLDDGFPARTIVHLDPPSDDQEGGTARYHVGLAAGERWRLVVAVQWVLNGSPTVDSAAFERRLSDDRRERDESLARWWQSVPTLHAPRDRELEETWTRSLADLAALRLRWTGSGMIPAAGLPWFMTLFGRDTLIAAFQTLPLGPDAARAALRALAETQSAVDDPTRDAEPGKIVHEIRRGKTALVWSDRYYGTVDATPLFLVLLSELWRWSGDDAIIRELEDNARRALAWIDGPGDADRDGFVEYLRRAPTGLDNQNWKDSRNSMVFRDGREARAPIASVEVQGYVYDAKLRTAELARRVWNDETLADRLERDAETLRARFEEAFWLPGHGWYALGLDHEKRPIDALASNMGHLLWSGLVPAERVAGIASRLTAGPLWSGWGIRTLAGDEAAFDPFEYHDGTIWPHDNSLIVYGLARAGRPGEVQRVARALLDTAPFFEHRLPELFAGVERIDGEAPSIVPSSARPQAWAAGTPVLLLRALLGLEPDPDARTLRVTDAMLPDWAEGLVLDGVHAFGRRFSVRVAAGRAQVDELG